MYNVAWRAHNHPWEGQSALNTAKIFLLFLSVSFCNPKAGSLKEWTNQGGPSLTGNIPVVPEDRLN